MTINRISLIEPIHWKKAQTRNYGFHEKPTKVAVPDPRVKFLNPLTSHVYLCSISAKKASKRRTKSDSLSSIGSKAFNFRIDLSCGSRIPDPAEFGHPGSLSTCSFPSLRR